MYFSLRCPKEPIIHRLSWVVWEPVPEAVLCLFKGLVLHTYPAASTEAPAAVVVRR